MASALTGAAGDEPGLALVSAALPFVSHLIFRRIFDRSRQRRNIVKLHQIGRHRDDRIGQRCTYDIKAGKFNARIFILAGNPHPRSAGFRDVAKLQVVVRRVDYFVDRGCPQRKTHTLTNKSELRCIANSNAKALIHGRIAFPVCLNDSKGVLRAQEAIINIECIDDMNDHRCRTSERGVLFSSCRDAHHGTIIRGLVRQQVITALVQLCATILKRDRHILCFGFAERVLVSVPPVHLHVAVRQLHLVVIGNVDVAGDHTFVIADAC